MAVIPHHGEIEFVAGEPAKLLLAENSLRLSVIIENNNKTQFRYALGGDLPTQTHGFRLLPMSKATIDTDFGIQKKDGMLPSYFTGEIYVIVRGSGRGNVDFCEMTSA